MGDFFHCTSEIKETMTSKLMIHLLLTLVRKLSQHFKFLLLAYTVRYLNSKIYFQF